MKAKSKGKKAPPKAPPGKKPMAKAKGQKPEAPAKPQGGFLGGMNQLMPSQKKPMPPMY